MNLFYQPSIGQGVHHLDEEESKHCIKVLRKKEGDSLLITDGVGFFYDTVITRADPRECGVDIRNKYPEPRRNFSIHIAISPTKNADRIEWFVEKTVELGIDVITLLNCEHTERGFRRTDRLKKISITAMKQSLRASLPIINDLTPFRDFIKRDHGKKFIAHVDTENAVMLKTAAPPGEKYVVLIGPEGDFSATELIDAASNGFQKVSLGPARLRTETAGMVACHILNLING